MKKGKYGNLHGAKSNTFFRSTRSARRPQPRAMLLFKETIYFPGGFRCAASESELIITVLRQFL